MKRVAVIVGSSDRQARTSAKRRELPGIFMFATYFVSLQRQQVACCKRQTPNAKRQTPNTLAGYMYIHYIRACMYVRALPSPLELCGKRPQLNRLLDSRAANALMAAPLYLWVASGRRYARLSYLCASPMHDNDHRGASRSSALVFDISFVVQL